MADSDSDSPDRKRQEPPPIEFVKPGEEQPSEPQRERPPAAWVTRPEDYQQPRYAQAPAPPRSTSLGTGRTARTAGALLILAAAVSIAYILWVSLTPLSPSEYANLSSDPSLYALGQVCGLIVTWAQAIMVLAGIMAFLRMSWRMAMGCAFFSMLMLGGYAVAVLDPILIGASFLGLVGFILTVTSRKEFLS